MSQPRATGGAVPDQNAILIRKTTRASHPMALAAGASAALLDNPPGRAYAEYLTSGTWKISYTRTSNAAFFRLEWWLPTEPGVFTIQQASVDLSITDGTTTIDHTDVNGPSGSCRIPLGFRGELNTWFPGATSDRLTVTLAGAGDLDLAALVVGATALNASADWTLIFLVTSTAAYVAFLQGYELPRWLTDDATTALGQYSGDYLPDLAISDGSQDGLDRLLATVQSARTVIQAKYLSLAWQETAAGSTPTITSAVDGPFSGLTEGAGATAVSFRVPVRQIFTPSAQGEVIRWRFRYSTTAGSGLKVTLHTGSSASPFAVTVADTAGAWAWSAWQSGYLASNTADGADAISITGNLTVAAHQAWIDAIQVEGNSL